MLQALITGHIAGSLMNQELMFLDVDIPLDDLKARTPKGLVRVTGRESGIVLEIEVREVEASAPPPPVNDR